MRGEDEALPAILWCEDRCVLGASDETEARMRILRSGLQINLDDGMLCELIAGSAIEMASGCSRLLRITEHGGGLCLLRHGRE